MDIRRLEAFSKVYECRSFSRAGQELFLSQPTISAHVSALEEELGVKLFDRMGRVVLPTQAADILYSHAAQAFETLEKARAEILLVQDRVAGELVIGGSTIPAHHVLPDVLAGFTAEHPDVTLELRVGDTRDIVAGISEGDLLLGMVGAAPVATDVAYEEVLKDELVFIASAGHHAAARERVTLAELAGMPWVMREQGSGTRRSLEAVFDGEGIDLRTLHVSVHVESTQSVLQCVRAGLGVSVTSRLAAGGMLERGELTELRVPQFVMERSFYLAYNERRHLFPAARYFIDYLRQRCREGFAGDGSAA
ncbi:DNA-binding transcriptional LysR family regulator [Desulfobaculum xiamenense]|uniref:DNA-binding transcriptional LysR family regulator n=1 Tax=Desulfobaculum xiamenense TaxID=995050 RepID=A0A846QSX5_9BACT|nr:selenium metabolism-associated LysR family transcriptional regulator [Desulfobaculum xiamenense]NJB69463.1 DNA-binding transcriptional LysR family regulator [Desulfobaculum xiamenense]